MVAGPAVSSGQRKEPDGKAEPIKSEGSGASSASKAKEIGTVKLYKVIEEFANIVPKGISNWNRDERKGVLNAMIVILRNKGQTLRCDIIRSYAQRMDHNLEYRHYTSLVDTFTDQPEIYYGPFIAAVKERQLDENFPQFAELELFMRTNHPKSMIP